MQTATRSIRVADDLWQAAQIEAERTGTTVTAVMVRALTQFAHAAPRDPVRSAAIVLARACLAGDESGVRVVIESSNPVSLTFAAVALLNEAMIDRFGAEEWDRRLSRLYAAATMDDISGGDDGADHC